MKRVLLFLNIFYFIFLNYIIGLNKIRYKEMTWNIYETPHFNIYYYKGEDFLAKLVAIYSEEAFLNNSKILNFTPKRKIPLFIYENHLDFSATNITLGYIGEGTGGFTEAFKNRVVLPGTGSLKRLKEVVFHEITHAIQYGILFGEGMRDYTSLYKTALVPMWIMEGQAEYCANDFDTMGDMILRDAVINDRLIPIDKLEGFYHLEEVYLAYKEAQSIFMYIDRKYGKDKISLFIKLFRNEISVDKVFKKSLKIEYNRFKKEWEFYLKKKYWAQIQGRDRPEKYGPSLTNYTHKHITYNKAPTFSPDGKKIIFISNKDGIDKIYMMDNNGKNEVCVFDKNFESIAKKGFPLRWVDNNIILFVATERGRKYLFKGNLKTKKIEKVGFDNFYNIYSPAVFKNKIAFVGEKNGFSDIYIYDINTKKIKNITSNIFANNFPTFSKDGKLLLFTEERNGYKRLVLCELKTNKKIFLTPEVKYDYLYPEFLNKKEIIYTSDKNGIYNLYKLDLKTGKETQLTNIVNGIFYPSVSKDFIVYSYYEDGSYNIYKYFLPKSYNFKNIPLVYNKNLLKEKSKKEKIISYTFDISEIKGYKYLNNDEQIKQKIEERFSKILQNSKIYSTTFTPDMLFALIGFSSESGLIGGSYIVLSDMLGNHNISLLANFLPGYFSQVDFSYLNLSLSFDLGINLFYHQNIYELYDVNTNQFFSQLDTTQYGGNIYLKYPLDLYRSIGINIASKTVRDVYTNYTDNELYLDLVGENTTNILNTISLFYIYDTIVWRDLWPFSGDSLLLYIENADRIFYGTKTYTLYELDYRKVSDLSILTNYEYNFNLYIKTLFAMTDGKDKPLFLFGGPLTLRGLKYGEYKGDKIWINTVELRYIIGKSLDFFIYPFNFLMLKNIKLSFFDDFGIVKNGEIKSLTENDIKTGIGISLIFDTFILQRQYLPIKLEFAKRTDIGTNDWLFYFYFNTTIF